MADTKTDTGIKLEFDTPDENIPAAPEVSAAEEEKKLEEDVKKEAELTPEERAQVDSFVEKIDLNNSAAIMNYGVSTQKHLADFSQKTIDKIQTREMGETGDMLTNLVTELKNFDVDQNEHGLRALFKKSANKVETLKAKYSSIEANVNTITRELEKHQVTLMKDIDVFDKMYQLNLNYFKELSMYILAGKKKLDSVKNTELKELQEKAEASGLPEDAEKAKDLADKCNRFEKKIYDLELSRNIALQTGPQIRLVQAADTEMAEKIQSTIVNTIPLWKNQMVIALGVEHSNQAAKSEREVNDMTNQLLKKNSEKLHQAVTESAKESERGIVDIETLKQTNESLISTIDEVISIHKNGTERRHEAEKELADLEGQLKQKLMEASRG
ncbi:MAG: toxic anion resistance protein [Lachnospiraceae bacterium]|uniref:Toxic anion resistance protein n=1 Tax=Candidatus Weimeria bifida TaxID=2599074 RepID=A0A6N7J1D1_9FIRM|nr:toxic anion resistance protein [Candidatus Weimeria bifida]RRF97023.1 MAG: toxic anion resistance protein [Lachnospiraceae bacterium]